MGKKHKYFTEGKYIANKNMKTLSLAIKEMQIKSRYPSSCRKPQCWKISIIDLNKGNTLNPAGETVDRNSYLID